MKRFNNIIANQNDFDQLQYYLETNTIPSEIKYKSRFLKKFEGFELTRDNKILYAPLDLEVVAPNEKQKKLEELYNNDNNILGKGAYNLFKYIQSKYIGITRNDVQQFIELQSNYQMIQPANHRVNKPIVSKFPNQLWAIDLIDLQPYMSSNYKARYIMTVVDIFSRKIWLGKLKKKEAVEARNAFEEICNRATVKPNYLISDNGNEWLGEFREFCQDEDIQQRFTRSYSPQANGIVERANREVRKILKAFVMKNNNFKWYNLLTAIEDNKNNSYHSSIKGIPNEVWINNKKKLTLRDLPESIVKDNPRLLARVSIVKKVFKQIRKFKDQDNFEVGDLVRVKMSSIFANVRRLVKSGDNKKLVVTYTPDTFRVSKVIIPKGVLERKRYVLENSDDKPVTTKKNNVVQFYGSELLLWDGENDASIDMERALKLNGVERNANDFLY